MTTTEHAEAMGRFPFPFPRDQYRYSANVERATTVVTTAVGAWGEHQVDIDDRYEAELDERARILDAFGAPIPGQCDGRSLSPFLAGEAPVAWRDEAHWEFDFRNPLDDTVERTLGLTMDQCALNVVRGERYKYVHFTKLPPLFFDLEADPGETRNLAADPAYAPVVLEYAQKLLSWRMNHDEQTLTHLTLTPNGPVSRPERIS